MNSHTPTLPLLLCGLAWLAAAPHATAGCNDLVVDIDPQSPWRFERPGEDPCEHGDVEEFTERRILISGDALAGPQCDLALVGADGRAAVEVDQNLCVAEGGAIHVRYRSGPEVPYASQEGSAGNGRAGLITFGVANGTPSPGRAGVIHLVTYNVFDRPYAVVQDGQDARMRRLPAALMAVTGGHLDAVVFQEAFNGDVLRYGLRRVGLVHQTPTIVDSDPTRLQNGGVFIASRWPITGTASRVYQGACNGADCLAAKGVVYARIEKRTPRGPLVFHVFGTHLQSGSSAESVADRLRQARQLRAFVDQQAIPDSEPVLIAGDLNEDADHHPQRVRRLASELDAALPEIPEGAYSSDPTTNELVGLDGGADDGDCCDAYLRSRPRRCACCPREFLDLVLYSRSHRQPSAGLELRRAVAKVDPFSACVLPYKCAGVLDGCGDWRMRDLSDHYPVIATYRW